MNPTNKFDRMAGYIEKIRDEVVGVINASDIETDYAELGLSHLVDNFKLDAKAEVMKTIINNNGYLTPYDHLSDPEGNERLKWKDLVSSPDWTSMFPKVVTRMVVEAWDLQPVLTSLLEYVPFNGTHITMPAISLSGQSLMMAEGDEPPELEFQAGGWKQVLLGKHGVSIKLTDEAVKYSNFPIFNILVRQASQALIRWKEQQAAKMITAAATSVQSGGSGVDATGTDNDGLTFDDIIVAMMNIINKGGNPDLLIVHPLAYQMFILNPSLRSFFFNGLAGVTQPYNWAGANLTSTIENLNGWTQRTPVGQQVNSITFPSAPFGRNLKVVMSPFVDYASDTKLTDVIIADSTQLGYIVQDQLPTAINVRDDIRMLERVAIVERYALAPKNEGTFIVKLSDVYAGKSYDPVPFYSINPPSAT